MSFYMNEPDHAGHTAGLPPVSTTLSNMWMKLLFGCGRGLREGGFPSVLISSSYQIMACLLITQVT